MSKTDDESDRFLREGIEHFLPAIKAMSAFVLELEARFRQAIRTHDEQLQQLGIVTSKDKLVFGPTLEKLHVIDDFSIGVRVPDRSGFYLEISAEKSHRSLYVGFWLYHPKAEVRGELWEQLRVIGAAGPFQPELAQSTIYIGRYVDATEHFPAFEPVLDELVLHVISCLDRIAFKQHYAEAFRKQTRQAANTLASSPAS